MPNNYTENADKWLSLSDLDYFTAFAKAWITFNAWYSNAHPELRTDREIIDEIKYNSNPIRNKFMGLVQGDSEEAHTFQNNLGHLHYCLLNFPIHNKGKRLYFIEFLPELNTDNVPFYERKRGFEYKIDVKTHRGYIQHVKCELIHRNGSHLLNYTSNKFDIDDIKSTPDFINNLSTDMKTNMVSYLNFVHPAIPTRFLVNNPNEEEHIYCGNYPFIKKPELIYKALIEILYGLRNVLFHGVITPNKDANKIYEPAYKVLKMLLEGTR